MPWRIRGTQMAAIQRRTSTVRAVEALQHHARASTSEGCSPLRRSIACACALLMISAYSGADIYRSDSVIDSSVCCVSCRSPMARKTSFDVTRVDTLPRSCAVTSRTEAREEPAHHARRADRFVSVVPPLVPAHIRSRRFRDGNPVIRLPIRYAACRRS